MTKKIFHAVSILALLLSASSCARGIGKIFPNRPDKDFQDTLKEASPEFKKGWEDGCEVGMSAGSNTFYKMYYRNNAVDGYKMTGSSDYKTAWGNAFWFCYRSDYIKQKSSIWGSFFSGYQ